MAMRLFYRQQSSAQLLFASFPFCSLQNAFSFRPSPSLPHTTTFDHCTSTSCCDLNNRIHTCIKSQDLRVRPPLLSHQLTSSRLFGSNPAESNKPGEISISDERDDDKTIPIDIVALHKTIDTVRDIIGYPTYDVSLQLIDEDYMKEVNSETRGVDKSTDVLSFCFTDSVEPGVLEEVPSHSSLIGDMYCLGDMLICVDYVARRCEEDKRSGMTIKKAHDDLIEGEVIEDSTNDNEEEDDVEYEYSDIEVEVEDEWDDRGVAPALLTTYDPEMRIHMLIVHGMLHLVGYDHEDDDEYELMVVKEDEVMAELKRRLGNDFGLIKRALPG